MMLLVLMLQVYISVSEHQLSSVCRDVRLFASRVCPLLTRALNTRVRMLHSELPARREEISAGPHQTGNILTDHQYLQQLFIFLSLHRF